MKNNLKKAILSFIRENGALNLEKKFLASSFYHSEDSRQWGGLARGMLVILLSNKNEANDNNAIGIELIHHASLIVDDLIDRTLIRRNKSSFWVRHGENEGILFAHKLINYAYQILDLNKAVFHTIDSMLYSELITQNNTINSIEQYVEMARRKTGKLYALAVDLSLNYNESLISNYSAIHDAFEKIGIAHQMLDDRLDYLRPESFQTDAAFEKAKKTNYYALTEQGYTSEQLDEIHIEIGTTALSDVEELIVVKSKRYLINLCHKIAFGSYNKINNKTKKANIKS